MRKMVMVFYKPIFIAVIVGWSNVLIYELVQYR